MDQLTAAGFLAYQTVADQLLNRMGLAMEITAVVD